MPPPVREIYTEDGQYHYEPEAPLDVSQPTAPGGESWQDFITKAYQSVTHPWEYRDGQYSFPQGADPYRDYGTYWNDLAHKLVGSGGQRYTRSPEFLQAMQALPPDVLNQAGANVEAINRPDEGFLGGSPLGDNLFSALAILGIAAGGAYAANPAAFSSGAAPAAGTAGAAGVTEGTLAATLPTAVTPTAGSLTPTVGTIGGTAGEFAAAGASGLGTLGGAGAPGLSSGLLAPTLSAGELAAGGLGVLGGGAGLTPATGLSPVALTPATTAPTGTLVPVGGGGIGLGEVAAVGGPVASVGGGASSLGSGAGGASVPDAGLSPVTPTPATTAPAGTLTQTSGGLGFRDIAGVAGPTISALGSLAGGFINANAAGDAAETQAQAAREANILLRDIYLQNREDLAPYREAGARAVAGIEGLPPFDASQFAYTPLAALDPGAHTFDPGQYAFTPPTLSNDPGYQFRLEQGRKALENSAAARGGLFSGGTGRALTQYAQDYASQEYDRAYQRGLTENQLRYERGLGANERDYGRAQVQNQQTYDRGLTANTLGFNRALAGYGTNLGRLQSLAGLGQSGTQATTAAAQNLGGQQAQNITSAGAATAAGQVGQANAINQGISGVGNAANNYLNYALLRDYLSSGRR